MKASSTPKVLSLSVPPSVMSPSSTSMQYQSAPRGKVEYVVLFPPGAMGLELEPVIKSSEREIGCRIKDFYFGVDYRGIEPAQLERLVNVGDIICAIDDMNVKSLPFAEIVDLLRSRKSRQRMLRFKNMSALCKFLVFCFTCLRMSSTNKKTCILQGTRARRWSHRLPNPRGESMYPLRSSSTKMLSTGLTWRKFLPLSQLRKLDWQSLPRHSSLQRCSDNR